MTANYNLTPEKKAQYKKEILEEINKGESKKPATKKVVKGRAPATNKTFKIPPAKKMQKILPLAKIETKVLPTKPVLAKVASVKKAPVKKVAPAKSVVVKKTMPIKKSVTKRKAAAIKKTITVEKPTLPRLVESKKLEARPVETKKVAPVVALPVEKKKHFLGGSISGFNKIYAPRPNTSKPKVILSLIVFVVLVIVGFLAVDIWGIYKYGWYDGVNTQIIKTLSLPAGTVNGEQIKLADYLEDKQKVKEIIAASPDKTATDQAKIEQQIFDRLASLMIAEKELKKYDKEVTNQMIEDETQKMINQVGDESKFAEEVQKSYQLNVADFKTKVLKPLLVMSLLQQVIIGDESLEINQAAKNKATDALNIALTEGVNFSDLAKQYSSDEAVANTGGDLGWFVSDELSPDLNQALFALSAGTVYNQITKDQYGYHIFRVDEKLAAEEDKSESIKLSQIVVTVDADLYLKSLVDKAVIKKYIQ